MLNNSEIRLVGTRYLVVLYTELQIIMFVSELKTGDVGLKAVTNS